MQAWRRAARGRRSDSLSASALRGLQPVRETLGAQHGEAALPAQAPIQLQQGPVTAEQSVCLAQLGQLQELLVVGVAAAGQRRCRLWVSFRGLDPKGMGALRRGELSLPRLIQSQQGIGQHALPFGVAVGVQQGAGPAFLKGRAQWGAARVAEDQQIQPHIGVQHQAQRSLRWRGQGVQGEVLQVGRAARGGLARDKGLVIVGR